MPLTWTLPTITAAGLSFLLFGCAHKEEVPIIFPLATGSLAVNYNAKSKSRRYIVWSTHLTVTASITQVLQSNSQTVLERSQLDKAFDEQRIRLTHTSDDETQFLRVGKLIGADLIVFADHTSTKDNQNLYRLNLVRDAQGQKGNRLVNS